MPCMPAMMSDSLRPRPSSTPTLRLRDSPPVQVSTRSPKPASPAIVSRRPPQAIAKRVISARPRVISAAIELCPSPSPSHTPAAIAIIFFSAPPSSTPTTSSFVYTRNRGSLNSRCTVSTSAASFEAIVIAVGSPRATSLANDGPLSAPIRGWNSPPLAITCEITSVMRNRVFSSKPLVALTNMILGCKCVRICSNKRLQCWEGITLTTISAPCSASSRLPVTNTQSGMEWPGRKSSLTRREEMESRTSFSKAHRRRR